MLLPVPHFHNVFTLPHEFNPLILYSERNQRALLKLLFDAAASSRHGFLFPQRRSLLGTTPNDSWAIAIQHEKSLAPPHLAG